MWITYCRWSKRGQKTSCGCFSGCDAMCAITLSYTCGRRENQSSTQASFHHVLAGSHHWLPVLMSHSQPLNLNNMYTSLSTSRTAMGQVTLYIVSGCGGLRCCSSAEISLGRRRTSLLVLKKPNSVLKVTLFPSTIT